MKIWYAAAGALILGAFAFATLSPAEPGQDNGKHLGWQRGRGNAEQGQPGRKGPGHDNGRHMGQRPGNRLAILKEMDTNDDKQITYEEFQAFMEKRMKERFAKMDRNGDGVISKDDAPEGMRHRRGARNGQGPNRQGAPDDGENI